MQHRYLARIILSFILVLVAVLCGTTVFSQDNTGTVGNDDGAKEKVLIKDSKDRAQINKKRYKISTGRMPKVLLPRIIPDPRFIDYLLFHKDVDSFSNPDLLPVHRASAKGLLSEVAILLESGADVNTCSGTGVTALMLAAKHGHDKIVDLLISHGAEINISSDNRLSEMPKLKGYGYSGSMLSIRPYQVNAGEKYKGGSGFTALVLAIAGNHKNVVEKLVAHGADVNLKSYGVSPLMAALHHNSPTIAELLIIHGAKTGSRDLINDQEINPLTEALDRNYCGVAGLLLQRSSEDINSIIKQGIPLAHYYSKFNKESAVVFLHDKGADLNHKCFQGKIVWYLKYDMEKKALFLIDNGANINDVSGGLSPLMFAADKGKTELVKLFIDKGAEVDLLGNNGNSALFYAAMNGNIESMELLVNKGADVNTVNIYGQDSFLVAKVKGLDKAADYLLSHGASKAAYSKHLSFISKMRRLGILSDDKNYNDIPPNFPIMFSAYAKNLGIKDIDKWEPDARLSSPEKTWQTYKQALIAGDFDLVAKCFIPESGEIAFYKKMGKERSKKAALDMKQIEQIANDGQIADYKAHQIVEGENVTFGISFVNVLGEWRLKDFDK